MSQFKEMAAQFMDWMLHNWPEETELLPFWVKETARQNPKRPAYVQLSVPDEWVKNVKGDERFCDTYIIMRAPAELFQRWTRELRGTALDNAMNAAQDVNAEGLEEQSPLPVPQDAAKHLPDPSADMGGIQAEA